MSKKPTVLMILDGYGLNEKKMAMLLQKQIHLSWTN